MSNLLLKLKQTLYCLVDMSDHKAVFTDDRWIHSFIHTTIDINVPDWIVNSAQYEHGGLSAWPDASIHIYRLLHST